MLSTHDPDHAFAIGSRVALMRDGCIIKTGAPQDVLTADRLEEVYGVPVTVERLSTGAVVCVPSF